MVSNWSINRLKGTVCALQFFIYSYHYHLILNLLAFFKLSNRLNDTNLCRIQWSALNFVRRKNFKKLIIERKESICGTKVIDRWNKEKRLLTVDDLIFGDDDDESSWRRKKVNDHCTYLRCFSFFIVDNFFSSLFVWCCNLSKIAISSC